jgi:hypothetical protein
VSATPLHLRWRGKIIKLICLSLLHYTEKGAGSEFYEDEAG